MRRHRLPRLHFPTWLRYLTAFLAGVALVIGLLAGRIAPPPLKVSGTWNTIELMVQIQAGEVRSISVTRPDGGLSAIFGPNPTDWSVIAQTRNGAVRVADTVPAPEILRGLAAFGYRDLFDASASSALRVANEVGVYGTPFLGIPFSVWAEGFNIFIIVAALTFTIMLLRRFPMARLGLRRDPIGRRLGAPDDPVHWADVAGADEAKAELAETVEFLRDGRRFERLGARVPRGVLLWGPPGTGKTLLARAVASEAGVPFFAVSGSEFMDTFVGVGPRRVRDLFEGARTAGGGVVFIDEIDAIGGARGGRIGGTEERDQTLNQILIELDGMERNAGIVVIGATNRLEGLDAALLRPGRLGRKVHVGYPDLRGRRAILGVHAAGKPIADPALLDELARKTGRMSGAGLADVLNEAAILAARRGLETIGRRELSDGLLKAQLGPGRARAMPERERSIIAAHEAGHALVAILAGSGRQIEEISLFAHGEALGVTVWSETEDRDLPGETELRATLAAIMGGRAAEDLCFTDPTAGPSHDYAAATDLARQMVLRWGLGRDPDEEALGVSGRGALGFLAADGRGELPAGLAEPAARAVRSLLDDAYAQARGLLLANLPLLWAVAAELTREERMDGTRLEALRLAAQPAIETEADWRSADARPRPLAELLSARDQWPGSNQPSTRRVPRPSARRPKAP